MDENKKPKKSVIYYIMICSVLVLAFNAFVMPAFNRQRIKETNYSFFLKQIDDGTVEQVEIKRDTILFKMTDENGNSVICSTGKMDDPDLVNRLYKSEKTIDFTTNIEEDSAVGSILMGWVIPIVFMIVFWNVIMKGMRKKMGGLGDAMSFGKSNAKIYVKARTGKTFADVAGQDEAKEALEEIVDFLHSPEKYTEIGASLPKGALLVGPPGTGKTLLAQAVAGEASVPFFSISGSEFVEMFVGMGAAKVRDLFKQANEKAPCIVFIDEIDTIGKKRDGQLGGNDEREQTLNQLLVEMDGMTDNNGIVIIAATNRPDVLDPALMRSGRFDRRVTVNLPDVKGRKEILQVHARNKHLAPAISLEGLAKRTPGFSGADLANVLNEGAILAVRNKEKVITQDDLDEAIDRVMMGPAKKSKKYTDKDKWLVSYHEAGHAVIGLKLDDADIVQKVTIIPRGDAGGYNLMMPKEEKYFNRRSELIAQITGLLGGRTAEELVFGEISAGAVNDIEKLTSIAKNMVRVYGMSSLGPIQYADPQGNVFLGRDYNKGSDYSAGVATEIDREVRSIIDSCHEAAKQLLTENRDLLDLIAHNLYEHETLTNEEITNLMNFGQLHDPNAPVLQLPEKAGENQNDSSVSLDLSKDGSDQTDSSQTPPSLPPQEMDQKSIDDAMNELSRRD